ncbi:MAG: outer membrane protein assembly factor BamD [Pseudomonadota bacterium]|nr:outer membrane protein assembly factor BamD [Pseudomonadota bacterium]
MIPQQFRSLLTPLLVAILSIFTMSISGCSSNQKKEETIKSEQAYYTSAQAALKNRNFFLAVEHLQNIVTHYPFGRYNAQAQLDLIYAHYESGSFESATASAQRFIQQYPRHPKLDYAYYMSALSTYDVDRGLITRVLPTTPSERSMKPVMESYQAFKKLVMRFPQSEYTADARQRMIYLRNILAEHEIKVGYYYLRRGAHLASVNRGQYVLKHFPNSPSVPDALSLTVKGYMELEMNDKAAKNLQILASTYPDFPELNDEGQLEYTRQSLREKRSWLNIISFGLLGNSGQ